MTAVSCESPASTSFLANDMISNEQSPSAKRKNQQNGVEEESTPGGASPFSRRRLSNTPFTEVPPKRHESTYTLDNSLRALYFAPLAMLVLDQDRNIYMLNGPAEVMLGVASLDGTGQQWVSSLPPTSQQTLTAALDEASQRYSDSMCRLHDPVSVRLKLCHVQGRTYEWVNLSISAWSQKEAIYDTTQEVYPRIAHDTFFTISLLPCNEKASEKSIPLGENDFDLIKKFAMQELELPFMAFSSQGKIVGRNRASDEIWSSLLGIEPTAETDASSGNSERKAEDFDVGWLAEMAKLTDVNFEHDFPESDWPVYRCAILGEKVSPILMGVESKINGKRYVVEYNGYPIWNNGQHIGGVVTFRNVTEEREKLTRNAEHQADVYFKETCNAIPHLVFVTDPVGKDEWYSDSFYQYSGAPEDVADTKSCGEFFHPDDLEEAAQSWLQAVELEQLWDSSFRVRRHDGAFRWFRGRALPIRDTTGKITKWYGTLTDINDQQESLSASRRAQSQLESVIHHADVTIWAVDREGMITIAKGPGLRQLKLTNSSSEAMIGRTIYEVWDIVNIQKTISQALDGETIVEEMEIDGRWFRTSFTPMRPQVDGVEGEHRDKNGSEIIGVVGASMDITERKAAQAQMEKSLLDKTSALAAEGAAREASRLKSEFLANMSHEIRTPIAGVIGLSELILDETNLTQQLRDYVETIQRSADGLLHVINDVLDISKVEAGKLSVEHAPFSLSTLLIDAKRMLSFATEKKGLHFRQPQELKYKGLLIGDFCRLKQVIINLLSNAIKFTCHGYISLEVTEFQETDDKLQVCFDIRDTGSGISKDTLARLFQPFSQADPSTARRFGGTGLGLSISKNLVELMGGKIGLESTESQGSHAWFSIPLMKAKGGEGERSDISLSPLEDTSGDVLDELPSTTERPRGDIWILIAEDNEVNARIAFKNVERMGFHCRIAKDGLVALQELDSRSYDLVLMDCHMPVCDGYEATRLLRNSTNSKNRALPVIALTASAITGDREKALEAGMVDYLIKPVKRSALESTLCKWLFDYHARQELNKYRRSSISSPTKNNGTDVPFVAVYPASISMEMRKLKSMDTLDCRNESNIGATASILAGRRFSEDKVSKEQSFDRSSLSSRSQLYGTSPTSLTSFMLTSPPEVNDSHRLLQPSLPSR